MKDQLLKHPDRISTYFKSQVPVLIIVTISGLIYNVGMLAGPYYEGKLAQCLYDIIQGKASYQDMLHLALFYVLVIAIVQFARAVKRFGVRRFANNISRLMRRNLYNSLVHTDPEKLQKENLGSLLTKAIADVDVCSEGMRKFTTEIFDTGVVMIAYICMLVYYDWRLTILCCMFTPLAYFAADRMKTVVTSANAAYKKSASSLSGMTMDRIENSLTYRVYGREENRNQSYETALTDYEKKSARANLFEGSLTPLYDAIAMLGAVMVIYFGARNVNGTGWKVWDIAAFTTYLACFTKLAVKASHAAKLFNAVQKASVSWKRIQPLMQEPVTDDFHPDDQPAVPADLSFDHVSVSTLLHDITFTAHPGEIIGITGEVASGKSSLGRVLIDEVPYTGSITINGKEFHTLSREEKLSLITYMGHDPELLSTSIEDNIALGSRKDVKPVLNMTDLNTDLDQLNRSIQDSAGEAGSMLSGGQQARVSLARCLFHARSLLVLDDPFASVDRTTETEILQNIRTAFPDRTILLISHRLYHFPSFDHVLYLHDGTGTFLSHEDMMKQEKGYFRLYTEQTEGSDFDEK
jgi:ATP-binding cassette subfamily B protein